MGVLFAYIGYPLTLILWARMRSSKPIDGTLATTSKVSIIIPAHNEEAVIGEKLENTSALDYPFDKFEIIVVSDGSSDNTNEIVEAFQSDCQVNFIKIEQRQGKANALNVGLQHATGEVIVFSDSSIMLAADALRAITARFEDERIGCISGEDHIPGGGGEGLYGRYELFLRNLESANGSIVGASGSLYAQRKELCVPFLEGLAPDFLSVLNTVEQGYRAVSEPRAQGTMSAVSDTQDELRRKIRTLLRGMSTLWFKRSLMNPVRYGSFAFALISHKLLRWLVPFFLIAILLANTNLLQSGFYIGTLVLQLFFYSLAALAWSGRFGLDNRVYGKIPLYFSVVNIAILQAWFLFLRGVRQEIWDPSKRVT